MLCNLILDEMSLQKAIEWDGSQFKGYVDLGFGLTDDTRAAATDALVFMAVAVNSSWKIAIAYFFTNGLSGVEKDFWCEDFVIGLRWTFSSPGDDSRAWRKNWYFIGRYRAMVPSSSNKC